MGKTIVINGKTYSERTVDNIVIDGKIINGNLMSEEHNKDGEMVNLDINVKSAPKKEEFSIQSDEVTFINSNEIKNKNIKLMNIDTNNKDEEKVMEKETLVKKLIKSIIRFLNKFVS